MGRVYSVSVRGCRSESTDTLSLEEPGQCDLAVGRSTRRNHFLVKARWRYTAHVRMGRRGTQSCDRTRQRVTYIATVGYRDGLLHLRWVFPLAGGHQMTVLRKPGVSGLLPPTIRPVPVCGVNLLTQHTGSVLRNPRVLAAGESQSTNARTGRLAIRDVGLFITHFHATRYGDPVVLCLVSVEHGR